MSIVTFAIFALLCLLGTAGRAFATDTTPSGSYSQISGASIALTWASDPTDVDHYSILVSTNNSGYTVDVPSTGFGPNGSTTYGLGVTPNVQTGFEIEAFFKDGTSAVSQPVSVFIPLPAPALSVKALSASQAIFSWTKDTNATSYTVYSASAANGPFTTNLGGTNNNTGSPPATSCILGVGGGSCYTVVATDTGTNSPYGNTVYLPQAIMPPPVPWCQACAEHAASLLDLYLATWGPLWSDPVDLMNGAEINTPEPDLTVYNPSGPSVSFQRSYRSDRALGGQQSPGLSVGWSHNYDVSIIPNQTYGWGPMTLLFDNGAVETLTPPSSPAANSSSVPFILPTGAPQIVTGDDTNGVTGVWKSLTVTMDDSSQWVFTPGDSFGTSYLLTAIVSRTGRKLDLQYTTPGFITYLSKFVDDATGTLLAQLNYNNSGNLTSIQDKVSGREVDYGYQVFTPQQGGAVVVGGGGGGGNAGYQAPPELYTVSQVSLGGGGATRYLYGYDTAMVEPLLNATTVPDPTSGNGSGTQTATLTYNDATGQVAKIVDANGNQTLYTYPGMMQATVEVKDPSGNHILGWTQNFDSAMRNSGTTDANGNTTVISYGDGNNPLKPTSVTTPATGPNDTLSHTTTTTYDAYGHVLTVTTPRGVVTTYTYKYTVFSLGRLMSVQETSGANSKQASSFTYNEPSGLVSTITSPAPGSTAASPLPEVTTSFTYDLTLGNVLTVTTPGNNATTYGTPTPTDHGVTTTFNYTTDGSTTATAAIGEPLIATDNNGNATHYRYDAQGLLRKIIDAAGNETDYDYAPSGQSSVDEQLEKITYPATGLTGTGQAYTSYAYQSTSIPAGRSPPSPSTTKATQAKCA